jgi:hypothetical protein
MQTCKSLLLQSITDESLFCLILDCEEKQQLDTFMASNRYHALLGAATVPGHRESLNMVEYRPVLPKS